MYNSGDDLSAVVCDAGSYSFRLGYAGDDYPKAYSSSYCGVVQDAKTSSKKLFHNINKPQENMHVEPFVSDGLISNWDYYEDAFQYHMKNIFKSNLKENPILLTEKAYTPNDSRHRLCELMFEKFQTPALFLAKDSVMSCYAVGKTSGLLVDFGASGTHINPINDGWVEMKGISRSPLNTRLLDDYMLYLLQTRFTQSDLPPIYPHYRIQKANILSGTANEAIINLSAEVPYTVSDISHIHTSYDRYMNLELGRSMKETLSRIADGSLNELYGKYSSIPTSVYELPDGRMVDVGIERYQIPEVYFDPSVIPTHLYTYHCGKNMNNTHNNTIDRSSSSSSTTPNNENGNDDMNIDVVDYSKTSTSSSAVASTTITHNTEYDTPATVKSIPRLIIDSIVKCDSDIQSSLLNNIILSGGGSTYEGLPERVRLETELLTRTVAPSWRIKTLAGSTADRPIGSWLGGSIVASLGSFHDMWVSKQEYQEYGASIVDRKCP